MFDFKWIFRGYEFMSECSNCPSIYFLIIMFANQYFRRQVERSAAESGSKLFGAINRPSKITNFSHSLNIKINNMRKDNVFQFDITMNDVMFMHVVNS